MTFFRKSYEVVGYTQDGAAYCADCWGLEPEPQEGNGGVVFLDQSEDLWCGDCGHRLNCQVINCTCKDPESEGPSEPDDDDDSKHGKVGVR